MALNRKREAASASPHQAIINKADTELATISQQIAAAQSEIEQATEELRTIQTRRFQLQIRTDQAAEQHQKVQAACAQAQFFAENLASGLPSEETAYATLEKARQEVTRTEQALASAKQDQEQEEGKLSQRVQTLTNLVAEKGVALTTLNQRRVSFQTAREQAYEAMGQETYERVVSQLQALQEQVTTQNRSFIDKKVDLKSARDAAITALAPWPHLREKILATNPYEDGTTRLLRVALAFLDTFEREARQVQRSIFIDARAGHVDLYRLCEMTVHDLETIADFPGERGQGTELINQRRELIEKALAQHVKGKLSA